ncbi:MAG: MFS transporter [Dehalococcoidia bacterium]|nr:MFS transporter [Dehalococcoidia bacterium]
MPDKDKKIFGLNPNIFWLGAVSFLTDVSSELIFTLMPLFLANILQTGTVIIGFVEGVAESTASLLKVASGWFSDKIGNRKELSFIGYALSTLAKPFMLIANTWGPVMGIRFADRFGKGIRSAPRDALVGDSCDESERGKAFGFHRAMDTSGAALGLVIAALVIFLVQGEVLALQADAYRWLVILGVIPAFIALFFFIFIHEPPKQVCVTSEAGSMDADSAAPPATSAFTGRFRLFLVILFIFTLGNSSDAFLILRAQNLGNNVLYIVLMLIVFNVVYALISAPAGSLSDKLGRKKIIALGWTIYALVYLGFAFFNQSWMVWGLWALYGVYYGLAEGVARALVCDLVPEDRRGTAFGAYHGVVGITLLPASLIAGWLWQAFSPAAPFYFGAATAVLAVAGLLIFIRE